MELDFPGIDEGDRLDAIRDPKNRLERIPNFDEKLWWLGWADGLVGQPISDTEALIRSLGEARNGGVVNELVRRREEEQARAKAAEDRVARLQRSVATLDEELATLQRRRSTRRHEFSLITGLLFVVVGISLLIADMPLSLQLVAAAFDMPTSAFMGDKSVGFGELFTDQRAQVFQHLWPGIVVAIGIALLGMFFKVAADFLLSEVSFFERLSAQKILPFLQALFFGGAFLLMVVGLFLIGDLRSSQHNARGAILTRSQLLQEMLKTSVPNAPASPRAGSQMGLPSASEKSNSPDSSPLVKWAFILMALAFPCIGGICFSLGWRRIADWWSLRTQQLARAYQQWRLAHWQARQGGELAQLRMSEAKLNAFSAASAGALPSPVDVPLSVYRHGYRRGFCSPAQLGSQVSLQALCRAIVRRLVARNVS